MEFFTIILEKSSSRQVLPDNFVKMLDGHRPQNMKLRQAGNGLRNLWDVEVVFDTDESMYDGNATFAVKVFDTTMCRRRYQDDEDAKMEFFTIILEKSSSTHVLPDNFVKMLDGHRPQNMKLRQAGNGLRKLWDVKVVFDTHGSMYLDRGWKQFVRAYDLRHGYFLVFSCFSEMEFFTIILEKSSSMEVLADNFVKMLDGHRPQNMKLRQVGNGLRNLWDVEVVFDTDGSMYLDRGWKQFVRAYDLSHGYFLVFSSDDGYSKSSSDDGLVMVIPQLGDRVMPIVVEEYILQPGLRLRRSKRIKMMKEKVKKQE
ncbi:b3 domain-containing protein [Hordeum vulgare]|nr:b3 domain-containing protein [Hordeum vulgare]